jgi:C_GCAxxG_C_C family probable redox protein
MIEQSEMDKQEDRVLNEQLKGRCCSQIIMELALEDLGKENEELVDAMAGFCMGMGKGEICGALAAAVAALHVADTEKATESWQDEFMDWFNGRFGAYDCHDIIHNDPELRMQTCPNLVLETWLKLRTYIG